MLAYPGVMQAARIMQTSGGEPIPMPTFDGTGMTASETSENTDQGSSSEPTFGRMTWNAYDLTTGMLKVPNQLFTDSVFNIDAIIARALGEALAREAETNLTTGNGVNKPYGVVTASTLGKTTAGATAITYEEIMDLKHAVPLAYRAGASYMMHDDVTHYCRKLKDSEGRFLWVNGTEPGMPDTLNGSRVYRNQAMTGFTSGALVTATKTMLCGNFQEYIVRRVGGIVLKRVEERYVEYNQTGFIAMMRYDGNILTAGATKIVHMLQA
jgi:HK97 family phage major capsid protein